MAVIRINLNDQVSAWLNKTNVLSSKVGDVDDLPIGDSTIVEALNRIRASTDTILIDIRDSAEIVDISRNSVSANDAGGLGSFSYSANTGTFTYTGPDQGDIRSLFAGYADDDSSATIEYDTANGTLGVKGDRLTSLYFADNAITTPKLADSSVTTAKLADASVTNNKIADGAVDGDAIADSSISSSKASSTSTLEIFNSSGTSVKKIVGWDS